MQKSKISLKEISEIEKKNKMNISKDIELKNEYIIAINRYNDIHFKKKMLLSLAKYSNIFQCENLKMRFEKNRIIIEKMNQEMNQ